MKYKMLLLAGAMMASTSALAVQVVAQGGAILVADDTSIIPANLNFQSCGTVIGVQGTKDIYDLTQCNLAQLPDACLATADFGAKPPTATVPCMVIKGGDGTEYVVKMQERGNSMNWDVTFVDYNYRKTGKK